MNLSTGIISILKMQRQTDDRFKKSQEVNSSHSHQELAKVLKSENFLDFYDDFVLKNARAKNRHLSNSSSVFKTFLNSDFIKTEDITEDLCKKFRASLLKKYNGETPGNYFARFKQVIKAGTKEGYFDRNPVEGIQSVKNHNTPKKERSSAAFCSGTCNRKGKNSKI